MEKLLATGNALFATFAKGDAIGGFKESLAATCCLGVVMQLGCLSNVFQAFIATRVRCQPVSAGRHRAAFAACNFLGELLLIFQHTNDINHAR